MSQALYAAMETSLTTLWGTVNGQARSGLPVFCGSAGTISKRRNARGVEFYVRRYYDGMGVQKEEYLARVEAMTDERLAELQEQIQEVKELTKSLQLLIREGFQSADAVSYATLAALHRHQLFSAGATLIGSHAFGVLLNQLGVRAPAYATEDVDVARREALILNPPLEQDFLSVLRESGVPFVEVPSLDVRQPATSFKQRGKSRFHVDLLVPSVDEQIRTVPVAELRAHATALPYLAYVLGDTQRVALLAREGACLVRVPSAERFALHKLVISQRRVPRDTKVDKDLFQASVLVAVLGDRYPGALESAMRALPLSTHSQLALAAARIWPALDAHPRAQEEFREAMAAVKVVWTEPAGG